MTSQSKRITSNGKTVGDPIWIADTYWKRLKGLLGKKSLQPGEGLLLTKVSSVHCFFMKFTIDVVYLSGDLVVLGMETIPPWGVGKWHKGTVHTLELAEGSGWATLQKGDQLQLEDISKGIGKGESDI